MQLSSNPPAARPTAQKALAAIVAGGASSRFGSPKALAMLGRMRVIDHVHRAVESVGLPVVLIANDAELFSDLGLPTRRDAIADGGPLAGVHAALAWARDEARPGALCVACDMPLVSPALLGRIVELAMKHPDRAVVPESPSRRGIEPLCAYYPVDAMVEIEAMLREGERRAADVFGRVRTTVLMLDEVGRFGDPAAMFLNVNTADDLRRAETMVRERGEGA
jgi:molybdenum cofactor guanylyltransferase